MKYAVVTGSGAIIYILIKNGSGIQKVIGGDIQAHRLE
jgi:hypothetical protein